MSMLSVQRRSAPGTTVPGTIASTDAPATYRYSSKTDVIHASQYEEEDHTPCIRALTCTTRTYGNTKPRLLFKFQHIPLDTSKVDVRDVNPLSLLISNSSSSTHTDDDATSSGEAAYICLENGKRIQLCKDAHYEKSRLAFAPRTLDLLFTVLVTARERLRECVRTAVKAINEAYGYTDDNVYSHPVALSELWDTLKDMYLITPYEFPQIAQFTQQHTHSPFAVELLSFNQSELSGMGGQAIIKRDMCHCLPLLIGDDEGMYAHDEDTFFQSAGICAHIFRTSALGAMEHANIDTLDMTHHEISAFITYLTSSNPHVHFNTTDGYRGKAATYRNELDKIVENHAPVTSTKVSLPKPFNAAALDKLLNRAATQDGSAFTPAKRSAILYKKKDSGPPSPLTYSFDEDMKQLGCKRIINDTSDDDDDNTEDVSAVPKDKKSKMKKKKKPFRDITNVEDDDYDDDEDAGDNSEDTSVKKTKKKKQKLSQ